MDSDNDIFFMKKALALAGKGRGKTFPNPMVGAVIVKNGEIAGEGWHRKAGDKHAEIVAIQSAGGATRGAALYVSLEPCSHSGLTPPCVDSIISAGISKVVCAAEDPDARVSGRGIAALRKAGVDVVQGVLKEESEKLNEVYIVNKTKNRPFVSLKSAMTMDGKIAARSGLSRWITSPDSRQYVHRLRAVSDAVFTGTGTVLRDNPRLSARRGKKTIHPYKVIAGSADKIPADAAILKEAPEKVIIASPFPSPELEGAGISVIECPVREGLVDLPFLFERLLERGISTVLTEAGGRINASLLAEKLVDRVYLFYAPKIFGGASAPTAFEGGGVENPDDAVKIKDIKLRRFGDDFLIEGIPVYI